MKNKIFILSISLFIITICAYLYLNKTEDKTIEPQHLKKVIFKDKDNELIPIHINFHHSEDLEKEMYNRLEMMKSEEFIEYGLFPVLNKDFQVNSISKNKQTIELDIKNIKINENAIEMIEALTFILTDYDDISQLKILENGKELLYFKDTNLPIRSLTKELGLNNFIDSSDNIHESISVTVYKEKVINELSYLIPTTLRIDEKESLKNNVNTILKNVNNEIILENVSLEDHILKIYLEDNILLNNEQIHLTLENMIVLSLLSLNEVDDVEIIINKENIRNSNSSKIEYNQLKF